MSLLDSNNDRDEINDRFHAQVSLLDNNNDRDEINDRFHTQVSLGSLKKNNCICHVKFSYKHRK